MFLSPGHTVPDVITLLRSHKCELALHLHTQGTHISVRRKGFPVRAAPNEKLVPGYFLILVVCH